LPASLVVEQVFLRIRTEPRLWNAQIGEMRGEGCVNRVLAASSNANDKTSRQESRTRQRVNIPRVNSTCLTILRAIFRSGRDRRISMEARGGRAAIVYSDVASWMSIAGDPLPERRSRKISLLLHFPQCEMLGTQPYGGLRDYNRSGRKKRGKEREKKHKAPRSCLRRVEAFSPSSSLFSLVLPSITHNRCVYTYIAYTYVHIHTHTEPRVFQTLIVFLRVSTALGSTVLDPGIHQETWYPKCAGTSLLQVKIPACFHNQVHQD